MGFNNSLIKPVLLVTFFLVLVIKESSAAVIPSSTPAFTTKTVTQTDRTTTAPMHTPAFPNENVIQTGSTTTAPMHTPAFPNENVIQTGSTTTAPTHTPAFRTETVTQTDRTTTAPTHTPAFRTETVTQTDRATTAPTHSPAGIKTVTHQTHRTTTPYLQPRLQPHSTTTYYDYDYNTAPSALNKSSSCAIKLQEIKMCEGWQAYLEEPKGDVGPKGIRGENGLTSMVAFNVQRTSSLGTYREAKIITYNKVSVNYGNAMNIYNGQFTCPISGLYFFTYSFKTRENEMLSVQIVQNDEVKNALFSGGVGIYGVLTLSQSNVLQLDQGDRVWLILFTSSSVSTYIEYSGIGINSFAGYLIHEIN